ncbi:MAG: hypothetical protein JO316_22520 [Abitibacteriaceae bacterium]|nr:hypothetical protein [Abditibacteriaceae bacterium]
MDAIDALSELFTPAGILIGFYVAVATYAFCRDCREWWQRRQVERLKHIEQHSSTVEVD